MPERHPRSAAIACQIFFGTHPLRASASVDVGAVARGPLALAQSDQLASYALALEPGELDLGASRRGFGHRHPVESPLQFPVQVLPGLERHLFPTQRDELVHRGVAPRFFTTHVAYWRYGILRSSDADLRQLVALAGVTDRWIPVTDDVRNTHDEALVVDRRLRQVGAHTIALVTSPMHTRRACATFESVGLRVYCAPAVERGEESETRTPLGEKDRLAAFKYYLYERLGWIEYRRRGWIK